MNPNGNFDNIETLILMALDAQQKHDIVLDTFKTKRTDVHLELIDQGTLLSFNDMTPTSMYTYNIHKADNRLVALTPDYLVKHPCETFGNNAEVVFFSDGIMKWSGFRKLSKAPKNVAVLGKPSVWYEMHSRVLNTSGSGRYVKRVVPFDKNGNPLTAKIQNQFVCSPSHEGITAIASASFIEDAHRANTMLATVKSEKEIKFPVPLDDYKELFADRDGPWSGNRRKSIIHWVSKHIRKTPSGNEASVKKHVRGIKDFTIDGYTINITPN